MSIRTEDEREDVQARKAGRLAGLRQDRRDALTVGIYGLAMLVMGTLILWFVVLSLRRGFIDLDDGPELLYAADAPVEFWVSSGFMAAFGLFCAQLGARMLRHTFREARRARRHAERVARAGTRRR